MRKSPKRKKSSDIWSIEKMNSRLVNMTCIVSIKVHLFTSVFFGGTEKIQKLMLVREEFDKFIETTENSQNKIDESVATLLYVVKKESDSLIRKKSSINS